METVVVADVVPESAAPLQTGNLGATPSAVEESRPAPITRYTPLASLPEVLNIDEACAWLDVERDHIYRLVATKKLPAIRLGRLIRISRTVLEKMMNGEKVAVR